MCCPSFSSSVIFLSRTSGRDGVCAQMRGALDSARANLPPLRCCAIYPKQTGEDEGLVLAIHAMSHWLWRHRIPLLPKLLSKFNRIVFAVELPAETRIGKGVRLNYSGLGTVCMHAPSLAIASRSVPAWS